MVNLDDPTAEPATSAIGAALVPAVRVVFCGDRVVFRDEQVDGALQVGRGVDERQMRLEHDARLSRHHGTFTWAKGVLRYENKSEKGSAVNGQRLEGPQEQTLADGDVVRLGDTFAVVRFVPDAFFAAARDVEVLGLIGRAPSIRQLRTLIDVVGPSKASIVVLGETGAGKDVVARALHVRSGRKGPLVAVNCAAIPESLAESQLFGHRQGSFTGAQKDHAGHFREANGGTLFLDEIGELPLSLQPKLLRVLDEKQVWAVGASNGVPIDVRVVVATNRDVAHDVERGELRADLFARLAEITISLPPLRARREDVLLILEDALPGVKTGERQLAPSLVEALLLHSWPFNVRELVKIATELDVKAQGRPVLDIDLLQDRVLGPGIASPRPVSLPPMAPIAPPLPWASTSEVPVATKKRDELAPAPDRATLEKLLRTHGGRVSDIARATGRSRTQVYRWLEQAGLKVDDFRGSQ